MHAILPIPGKRDSDGGCSWNRLQQQRRSGGNFYDACVNDSDFLGTPTTAMAG